MEKSADTGRELFHHQKRIPIRLPDGEGFITFTHIRNRVAVNQFHGPFSQNVYEIYMHIDGTCNILIDGRIYSPRPGDLFLYRPNQIHALVPTTDVQERFYVVFTANAFDSIDCDPSVISLFDSPEASANHLVFPHVFSKSIMEKLYQISQNVQQDTPEAPYLIYGNTLRILAAIKKLLDHASTSTPLASDCPQLLLEIVNHIQTRYQTTKGLQQICEHFGISRSHLTRLFTAHIGITPYSYLQSLKLSRAKQLLSQGSSVTEACFDSGFSDYSNFIQLFRKQVGVSPLTYKKQHDSGIVSAYRAQYKIE